MFYTKKSMQIKSRVSSVFIVMMFISSIFAGFSSSIQQVSANGPIPHLGIGEITFMSIDGFSSGIHDGVMTVNEEKEIIFRLHNNDTQGHCIDEIIITFPPNWQGSIDPNDVHVTNMGTVIITNEKDDGTLSGLTADPQSIRIVPDNTNNQSDGVMLCPSGTTQITIDEDSGLQAPSNPELSDIAIYTSDQYANEPSGSFVRDLIMDLPQIQITDALSVEVQYIDIESFIHNAGGADYKMDAIAKGGWGRLTKLYLKASSNTQVDVYMDKNGNGILETGTDYRIANNKNVFTTTTTVDLTDYSGVDISNGNVVNEGFLIDWEQDISADAVYFIDVDGAQTLTLMGHADEDADGSIDPTYQGTGFSNPPKEGTVINVEDTMRRSMHVQLIRKDGSDRSLYVKESAVPIYYTTDLSTFEAPSPRMTDSDGQTEIYLLPGTDAGNALVTIIFPDVAETEEHVAIAPGVAYSFEITKGLNTEVEAGTLEIIEATIYDQYGNVISNNPNKPTVSFNITSSPDPTADLDDDTNPPFSGDGDGFESENANLGKADASLKTSDSMGDNVVEVCVKNPNLGCKTTTVKGTIGQADAMECTLSKSPIVRADECFDILVNVVDSQGNPLPKWESIVEISVDDTDKYILSTDLREERISADRKSVLGKLNPNDPAYANVTVCGCDDLGLLEVTCRSDTLEDDIEVLDVINSDPSCIDIKAANIGGCDYMGQIHTSIVDTCGNPLVDNQCGPNSWATSCVALQASCGNLSTAKTCVDLYNTGMAPVVDFDMSECGCGDILITAIDENDCCASVYDGMLPMCDFDNDNVTNESYVINKIGPYSHMGMEVYPEASNQDDFWVSERTVVDLTLYDGCNQTYTCDDHPVDLELKGEDCVLTDIQVDSPLNLTGQCYLEEETPLYKIVFENCANATKEDIPGKEWTDIPEKDDILVDKIAFRYNGPTTDVEICIFEENEETAGFQLGEDIKWTCSELDNLAMVPMMDHDTDEFGAWDSIHDMDNLYNGIDDLYLLELDNRIDKRYLGEYDNQRMGGALIEPGDTKDFYIVLMSANACGLYDVDYLYFQDYNSPDWIEWSEQHLDNWTFFEEIASGKGKFVAGPDTPPLGAGSANFIVNGSGRMILYSGIYNGMNLSEMYRIQYSTYQNPLSGGLDLQAISLQFNVDYDCTDGDTSWQGRLVFEPYLTPAQGAPVKGMWQTWDARAGNWWASGAPGSAVCTQGSPCSFDDVLTNFPDACIHKQLGAVLLKAGGPWTGGFIGNADALIINNNTHDFTSTHVRDTIEGTEKYTRRNDDYIGPDPYPWKIPDTRDYGFGDRVLHNLGFVNGKAVAIFRDLVAETVRVIVNGFEEVVTFVPQPATQVVALNHGDMTGDQFICDGDGFEPIPDPDQKCPDCKRECRPAMACSEEGYDINLQVTDGFQNQVPLEGIKVQLESCLEYPHYIYLGDTPIPHMNESIHNFTIDLWKHMGLHKAKNPKDVCFDMDTFRQNIKEILNEELGHDDYFATMFLEGTEFTKFVEDIFNDKQVSFYQMNGSPAEIDEYGHPVIYTDSNGRAQFRVKSNDSSMFNMKSFDTSFRIFTIPYALDADYFDIAFSPGEPYQYDIMALPESGVPADGEQESKLLIRKLDMCGNPVMVTDEVVTVEVNGSAIISRDFEGNNNYDQDVTGSFQGCHMLWPWLEDCSLTILSDVAETVRVKVTDSTEECNPGICVPIFPGDTHCDPINNVDECLQIGDCRWEPDIGYCNQPDITEVEFVGAPRNLVITEIKHSDLLPADGFMWEGNDPAADACDYETLKKCHLHGNPEICFQTCKKYGGSGGWMTVEVQDKYGKRVTGYLGDGLADDPGDVYGLQDNIFENICIAFDDPRAFIDDYSFGWINLQQKTPGAHTPKVYCGDLAFGKGSVHISYATFDRYGQPLDPRESASVAVSVFDKCDTRMRGRFPGSMWDDECNGQEYNENNLPDSETASRLEPDYGQLDYVAVPDRWDMQADKYIVAADGKDYATITINPENEYFDVRTSMEATVQSSLLGSIIESEYIHDECYVEGLKDPLNPTSIIVNTEDCSGGKAKLKIRSTEPGISKLTVTGNGYGCKKFMNQFEYIDYFERTFIPGNDTGQGGSFFHGDSDFSTFGGWWSYCSSNHCMGELDLPYEYYTHYAYWYWEAYHTQGVEAQMELYTPMCLEWGIIPLTPKTIEIDFKQAYQDEIVLKKGWNYFSIPEELDTQNDSWNELGLNNICDASAMFDESAMFNESVQAFTAPVPGDTILEPLEGYWCYVPEDRTLPVKVKQVYGVYLPPTKHIYEGWNDIGLTSRVEMKMEHALISIDKAYTHILDWIETLQKYTSFANTGEAGGGDSPGTTGTGNMEVGQAYMLWSTEESELASQS